MTFRLFGVHSGEVPPLYSHAISCHVLKLQSHPIPSPQRLWGSEHLGQQGQARIGGRYLAVCDLALVENSTGSSQVAFGVQ